MSEPILVCEGVRTQRDHSSTAARQRDPDFVKAEAAMKRASMAARERARKFGLGVVIIKDGRIVEECSDGAIRSVSS